MKQNSTNGSDHVSAAMEPVLTAVRLSEPVFSFIREVWFYLIR